MILEPQVRVILHCDRCNKPFTDDDDAPILWVGQNAIDEAFAESADVCGWRIFGNRFICLECQIFDHEEAAMVEDPELLSPIEAAVIVRAQALQTAGMLNALGTSDVLRWLSTQPESALREALTVALEAARHGGLESWGPAPGSKSEGELERGLSVLQAVEYELRPSIVATEMERV
jgi:hypothetical protein